MTPTDIEIVDKWWKSLGCRSAKDCYPVGSSYIYQRGKDRLYAFALHFVQGSHIAYIDGYIRNPEQSKDEFFPHNMTRITQDFAEAMCKERGVKKLFGSTKSEKLLLNYMNVGYIPNKDAAYTFSKEIF